MATEEELKTIAQQLALPTGSKGLEIARMMETTNANMTAQALDALDMAAGQHVVEIGHGNASHLAGLLQRHPEIRYTGLETSVLMQTEAINRNREAVSNGRAKFFVYNGITLPDDLKEVDRIVTVNCIYFWPDPADFINQLATRLLPKGRLIITFATKQFMEQLPFTGYGFRLYEEADLLHLTNPTNLRHMQTLHAAEQVRSKAGQQVERKFSTMVWEKR